MSSRSTKRLPKARRREKLLEAAQRIVREQGTDALALGYLAERAGVSKPLVYDHFGSRSGLLTALYRRVHDEHVAALLEALEEAPAELEAVADVVSAEYMSCCASVGAEWHAIAAAMRGEAEMEAMQLELADEYVALYRDAFAPYTSLPDEALQVRCAATIGAAEALSLDMIRGRMDQSTAAATLASLIVTWLRNGSNGLGNEEADADAPG